MEASKNYTQICDLGRKIFSQYEGTIVEEDNRIKIKNKNVLEGKRIECVCEIGLLNSPDYPYSVDASEKTCCILGGTGSPCKTLEEVEEIVIQDLDRFQFKKKQLDGQMSMFDVMEEKKMKKFAIVQRVVHHLVASEDYATDLVLCHIDANDMTEAKEIAMRVLFKGNYQRGKKDTGGDNWIEYKYRVEEVK